MFEISNLITRKSFCRPFIILVLFVGPSVRNPTFHWFLLIFYTLHSNTIHWKCFDSNFTTVWGRVTHICVSELTIIGSEKGLSPGRRQTIIWNNAGLLSIEPLRTNFSDIWIGIQTFSFKKMHLNMSSANWRPFCLGLNVLRVQFRIRQRHYLNQRQHIPLMHQRHLTELIYCCHRVFFNFAMAFVICHIGLLLGQSFNKKYHRMLTKLQNDYALKWNAFVRWDLFTYKAHVIQRFRQILIVFPERIW